MSAAGVNVGAAVEEVGDVVGLVYALGYEQAVVSGHDWEAIPAYNAANLRRDMFRAVVLLTHNGKVVAIAYPPIQAPNPALDKGVRLPGFNDDFTGAAPNIGVFETGLQPLRFGREMAPGFTRAPWER